MKARKMPFDTLRFANRMKAAGMAPQLAEEQAEAIAEALYDGLEVKIENLVTGDQLKAALAELKTELKTDIADLRAELKADHSELRIGLGGLKLELEQLEKKLGRLVIGGFSLLALIFWLLQHFHV